MEVVLATLTVGVMEVVAVEVANIPPREEADQGPLLTVKEVVIKVHPISQFLASLGQFLVFFVRTPKNFLDVTLFRNSLIVPQYGIIFILFTQYVN